MKRKLSCTHPLLPYKLNGLQILAAERWHSQQNYCHIY